MHKKNFFPLTPINFLKRSAEVFPNYLSIISENQIFTWKKTYDRCKMFCSALKKRGIKNGDVVSIMSPNITELYEAHFAIQMAGAIINTINIRLGLNEINFILNHSRSKLILIHENYLNIIKEINKKKNKKNPLYFNSLQK